MRLLQPEGTPAEAKAPSFPCYTPPRALSVGTHDLGEEVGAGRRSTRSIYFFALLHISRVRQCVQCVFCRAQLCSLRHFWGTRLKKAADVLRASALAPGKVLGSMRLVGFRVCSFLFQSLVGAVLCLLCGEGVDGLSVE